MRHERDDPPVDLVRSSCLGEVVEGESASSVEIENDQIEALIPQEGPQLGRTAGVQLRAERACGRLESAGGQQISIDEKHRASHDEIKLNPG